MTLEEAMDKYRERFDDQYPLYCSMGMSDGEIIAEIEDCLQRGEPFAYDDEAVY